MKTHTSSYKENVKKFGRQLDSKIRYTLNGESIELGGEQLNSITPHYQGGILKSVMRQLDIDSNVEIPLETILTYEFGVKVGSEYEYINFGNYIVYSSEKQEDTNSWKIVCYDKMLYSMKDYETMNITYPITIRNYINAICTHLGLTFKNASDTFANYDKEIPSELYLDSEGRSLDYTFRDVLDQLAEVTASTICINENDDELEIRYINNTNDTIDEEYLKDVNVNFGEKFGPVNTIVLSRSAGADNIYYPSVLPENPCEIKISDNLIMNDNNRDTYMPDIYNQLNDLEYYINDFSSTGITYYNLCDRYNVQIGENTYSCVMFNDEVNVTQGLEESVYTDFPKDSETDYKKADKTDRKINQTTLIVDKQNQQIQALITNIEENNEKIDALQPTQEATGIEELYLPNSAGKDLIEYRLKGKSEQVKYQGNQLVDFNNMSFNNTSYTFENDVLTVNASGNNYNNIYSDITNIIKKNPGKTLKFDYESLDVSKFTSSSTVIVQLRIQKDSGNSYVTLLVKNEYSNTYTIPNDTSDITRVLFQVYANNTSTANDTSKIVITKPMLQFGTDVKEYEPFVGRTASPNPNFPQDVKSIGDVRNLFDKDNMNSLDGYLYNKKMYIRTTDVDKMFYIPCKPNTTYTVSRSIITSSFRIASYDDDIPTPTSTRTPYDCSNEIDNNNGTFITITTGENTKFLIVHYGATTKDNNLEESLATIQIVEGSETDYIPHGNYIDAVNRGKNLFNKEYAKNKNNYNVTINGFQCFALQLKPNTKYTISQDMNGYAKTNGYYYDVFNSDKTSIKRLQSKTVEDNLTVTFTTGDMGVIYFGHIYGFSNDNRVPLYLDTAEIQLEEGVNVTPYEPYTTIHNYINLTQPLPSLPDGTADELIIKDGHAKIIQNVGRVVLDGSEDGWSKNNYAFENTSIFIGKPTSICSHFTNAGNNWVSSDESYRGKYTTTNANDRFKCMPLVDMRIADFKTWLSNNNVLLQYALAEPIEIDLGEVSIKTIDGNDYLYITDPIKSDMYAKYIRNTTLNDVYYTKTETNSQIKIVKDEIDLTVDRIDDLTPFIDSKTGSNYLHLEKTFASEGAIRSLSIKGFTLFPLYPGMSYPSDTQYPGANSCYKLYFDTVYPVSSTKKTVEIMSPIPLQTATISGVKIQDELLIENNKISVIQNLGYNSSNQLVKLSQSIIHDLGELPIPTLPYDTYITVENYNNDTLSFECEYLQANPYTDIFATQSEMSAKFSITDSNINSKVSKNNIISEINQSAEEVSIDASKITLSGYTSINDSFSVDEQGNFSVESPSSGIYDYNIFDLRTVYAIIQDKINVDSALLNVLDTDDSGKITSFDYVKIYNYLDGSGTLQKNVTSSFEFDPTNPKYCIAVKNSGLITASMGSGGINANIANIENLICCKAGNSVSMVNDPLLTINGSTAEMFAQVGQIFSKVKPGEIIVKDTSGYQTVSTITPNGITTPTVTQTSLEENKKNFEIFKNALDIINDIDLYKYNLKIEDDNHKKHIGFVIGENYKYSSEITAVDDNGKEIGVDNYSMTSLCLQAIKEQQEIIKQLQNEIKDLKERIDK